MSLLQVVHLTGWLLPRSVGDSIAETKAAKDADIEVPAVLLTFFAQRYIVTRPLMGALPAE